MIPHRYGLISVPQKKKLNVNDYRKKPSFKPQGLNRPRSAMLRSGVNSSGYGRITPGPRIRGDLAREKVDGPAKPTFQPQLHLSKASKKMRAQLKQQEKESAALEQSVYAGYDFGNSYEADIGADEPGTDSYD